MDKLIETGIENFNLRFATVEDVELILSFIKELAEYEKLFHEVVATCEKLKETLFDKKIAEVIIGEYKDEAVGFCLFFHNYSTFLGKAGIHLEDLFIKKEFRGHGFGKVFLSFLGKVALDRDCGRLEWSCLDWNKSAIDFYKKMGATSMDEWITFRVTDETLKKLGDHKFSVL
jgi:GNAT superfamily N-acetyltransferase